jgi:hypothetical protein
MQRQSESDAWLIESHYVAAGYVIVAATGGLDSDMNPVGFREQVNTAYHGLRHIPGPWSISDNRIVLRARVRRRGASSWRSSSHAGNRKHHYTPPTIQK